MDCDKLGLGSRCVRHASSEPGQIHSGCGFCVICVMRPTFSVRPGFSCARRELRQVTHVRFTLAASLVMRVVLPTLTQERTRASRVTSRQSRTDGDVKDAHVNCHVKPAVSVQARFTLVLFCVPKTSRASPCKVYSYEKCQHTCLVTLHPLTSTFTSKSYFAFKGYRSDVHHVTIVCSLVRDMDGETVD